MRHPSGISKALLCIAVLMFGLATNAGAGTITFDMNYEFSGAAPPQGTAPWITATFADTATPGTVRLTMSTANLIGTEFVSSWYFNLDPNLSPINLTIAPIDTSAVSSYAIFKSANDFKADGDGKYDIMFSFPTSESDNRFTRGETVIFDFTIEGLTASSFDFISYPDGGHGPYKSAAHVQGIVSSQGDSGWVAPIPEPGTMILLGSGLLGLAIVAGRKKFRQ